MNGEEGQDPLQLLLQAADMERLRHREEQRSMDLHLIQRENKRLTEELIKTQLELERSVKGRTSRNSDSVPQRVVVTHRPDSAYAVNLARDAGVGTDSPLLSRTLNTENIDDDVVMPPSRPAAGLGSAVSDTVRENTNGQIGAMAPLSQNTSLADALAMFADVITKKGDGLPKKETVRFQGDIFEFPVWLNSFKVLVEDRYPDAADRMYYLGRYTAGEAKEAKEAIKGLLLMSSSDAYVRAKAILQDRFGNKIRLAQNFREKLAKWPQVKTGKSLREFADFLNQCEGAMSTLGQLSVLNDSLEQDTILTKLPRGLQIRWIKFVDNWQYEDSENCRGEPRNEHPPFSKLCAFIEREARILCNPLLERQSSVVNVPNHGAKRDPQSVQKGPSQNVSKGFSVSAFATNSDISGGRNDSQVNVPTGNNSGVRAPAVCLLCQRAHSLESFAVFRGKSLIERLELVKGKGLCLGCFKKGHKKFRCLSKMKCEVCQLTHPTLLHDYSRQPAPTTSRTTDQNAVVRCTKTYDSDTTSCDCAHSLIVPVSIYHKDHPLETTVVYALLDDQANACLVLDSVLDKLNVHGDAVNVKMSTALGEEMVACQKVDGLVVRGLRESSEVNLPAVLSHAAIPADPSQVPRPETARKWKHLEKIAEELTRYLDSVEVGIIIGNNCTKAIRPLEIVPGDDNDPYGVRTALGWGVVGRVGNSNNHSVSGHFVYSISAKEMNPSQVVEMFQLEFNERETNPDAKTSVNDKRFIQLMKDEIHVRDDGHFETPLPLPDDVRMPNNRPMVEKRLKQLKGRLSKNQQYREDYKAFMDGLLKNGFAERVPEDELDMNNGKIWYIPHHGVYHPHKPGKIRVVFDCSAEYNGAVLNKQLLQGPDITNNLTGVLCRFRKGLIAFSCDIEGMFHQVGVNREHRNFLRFLW
ncbi:uncharacterized protein LOC135484646 [Lineus longissimus]|uniref:uncharacterized protein LOC135484646 n=1 Tax=Lineus longissimus TaxID=88925 RepID=UPI00315DF4D9